MKAVSIMIDVLKHIESDLPRAMLRLLEESTSYAFAAQHAEPDLASVRGFFEKKYRRLLKRGPKKTAGRVGRRIPTMYSKLLAALAPAFEPNEKRQRNQKTDAIGAAIALAEQERGSSFDFEPMQDRLWAFESSSKAALWLTAQVCELSPSTVRRRLRT